MSKEETNTTHILKSQNMMNIRHEYNSKVWLNHSTVKASPGLPICGKRKIRCVVHVSRQIQSEMSSE